MTRKKQRREHIYRREFVSSLAERLGISTDDADEITAVFLDLLRDIWCEQHSVCFPGFGVFELRPISEKMGRNPRTMEEYPIHASYKPTLRASRELRAFITQRITDNRRI